VFLVDDHDIAFHLDEHLSVYGIVTVILTVEETRLRFSVEIVLAVDDRWPVELDVAYEHRPALGREAPAPGRGGVRGEAPPRRPGAPCR
jgi:hypothetical protein